MIHRKDQQKAAEARKLARRLLELGHMDAGIRLGQAAETDVRSVKEIVREALEGLALPEDVAAELRKILE